MLIRNFTVRFGIAQLSNRNTFISIPFQIPFNTAKKIVHAMLGLVQVCEHFPLSGYHADTPITIKAEPSIWPTAAFINIHEHPL